MQEGEGGSDRSEDRQGERVGRGVEGVEAGKRENETGGRWRGRDEAIERGRDRGGRVDTETRGRSNGGGVTNNGMRNAVGGREGVRPEHRGELPGLSSCGQPAGLDGGLVINGNYFQTSIEARKPSPVKQKLSEALSLISLTRRLQGPTRVGDEQRSNGWGWDRGEENRRKIYGAVGDMSVSAAVSERGAGEEGRRWERRELGEEDSSSEGWWKRERRSHDTVEQSDSETGSRSKGSPSELSLSDASSLAPSVRAGRDKTESETETDRDESDSGTERETPDTDRESASGSQGEEGSGSEEESGLESEDERRSVKSASSSGVSGERRHGGAKRGRKTASSSRYSGSAASGSRPKTSRHSRSSHKTIEEESEEEEEEEQEEEVKSVGAPHRRASSHIQSDVIDSSDDLSPIIEDTEEEEEERSRTPEDGDSEDGEAERGLESESAD